MKARGKTGLKRKVLAEAPVQPNDESSSLSEPRILPEIQNFSIRQFQAIPCLS